jgi:cytochrome P450
MLRSFHDLPGPPLLPLIGNPSVFLSSPLDFLTRQSQAHGGVWRNRIGRQRTLILTDPDLIEQVFIKHRASTVKDPITAGLSEVLGQGLLTAEGETWRQSRRLIAPSFQPRHLADLGQTMVASSQRAIEAIGDGPRDVHDDMMSLTLDIAVRTLFGTVMSDTARVGPLVAELMAVFEQETHTWRRLLPDWISTQARRTATHHRDELHRLLLDIVQQRRAAGGEGSDLLSRLLAAQDEDGRGMDDDQLRDEMLTLFLAGHETTALTLSYALWLLAEHPEALAAVRGELDDVLGGRTPDAADSRRLPWLDAVVQESMRLYPPAWIVGRAAAEDIVLTDPVSGDIAVRAGTVILMPQWVVHRDARWFSEPLAFRPQRWLDETARPRFSFFPFGGGQRICVGSHFARMESILVLATWLQAFDLRPAADFSLKVSPSVTLRPVHGVRVHLTRRDRSRIAA